MGRKNSERIGIDAVVESGYKKWARRALTLSWPEVSEPLQGSRKPVEIKDRPRQTSSQAQSGPDSETISCDGPNGDEITPSGWSWIRWRRPMGEACEFLGLHRDDRFPVVDEASR